MHEFILQNSAWFCNVVCFPLKNECDNHHEFVAVLNFLTLCGDRSLLSSSETGHSASSDTIQCCFFASFTLFKLGLYQWQHGFSALVCSISSSKVLWVRDLGKAGMWLCKMLITIVLKSLACVTASYCVMAIQLDFI